MHSIKFRVFRFNEVNILTSAHFRYISIKLTPISQNSIYKHLKKK